MAKTKTVSQTKRPLASTGHHAQNPVRIAKRRALPRPPRAEVAGRSPPGYQPRSLVPIAMPRVFGARLGQAPSKPTETGHVLPAWP